jgi:hypothetical protein
MKGRTPADPVYEGAWFYEGYHRCKSVCYLRLYQPRGDHDEHFLPAVAIFTEVESNEGTSVTNRIEVLAGSAWEFLLKPEEAPLVIEHYPNHGYHNPHADRWQFPESFDLVEFDRGRDGSFQKPRWKRIQKEEVEALIGRPLETRK